MIDASSNRLFIYLTPFLVLRANFLKLKYGRAKTFEPCADDRYVTLQTSPGLGWKKIACGS